MMRSGLPAKGSILRSCMHAKNISLTEEEPLLCVARRFLAVHALRYSTDTREKDRAEAESLAAEDRRHLHSLYTGLARLDLPRSHAMIRR